MAIIILAVGAFVILPLLQWVSTSLRVTNRTSARTESYYARDAGVEYAIATLMNDRDLLTGLSSQPSTPMPLPLPQETVNGLTLSSITAILVPPGQWDQP